MLRMGPPICRRLHSCISPFVVECFWLLFKCEGFSIFQLRSKGTTRMSKASMCQATLQSPRTSPCSHCGNPQNIKIELGASLASEAAEPLPLRQRCCVRAVPVFKMPRTIPSTTIRNADEVCMLYMVSYYCAPYSRVTRTFLFALSIFPAVRTVVSQLTLIAGSGELLGSRVLSISYESHKSMQHKSMQSAQSQFRLRVGVGVANCAPKAEASSTSKLQMPFVFANSVPQAVALSFSRIVLQLHEHAVDIHCFKTRVYAICI